MNLVFVDLAREAGATWQAAARPSWIEGAGLAIAGAQVVIYGIGRAVLFWHLREMGKYGQQRDREIDALAARLHETNRQLAESTRQLGQQREQSRHGLASGVDT